MATWPRIVSDRNEARPLKIQRIDATHITSKPGEYPAENLPEIAFLGRSNVGKSSLINSLVNRKKLARTSKAPGRTRAIHWYRLQGEGAQCYLVDLPGYGYAKVSRRIREEEWAELIGTYLESDRQLALAIQLLDIRRDGPTDLDWQMIEWLQRHEVPTVYVLTKSDKLGRGKRAQAVAHFARELSVPDTKPPIAYSAMTGEGKTALWSIVDRSIALCS